MQNIAILCMVLLFIVSGNLFGQTTEDLVKVTTTFLNTLDQKELQAANLNFGDPRRTQWTNLPLGLAERPGIRYGDLSADSKIGFHHILTTIFSSQGYLKTTSIMLLENFLLDIYEIAYEKNEIDDATMELWNLLYNNPGNTGFKEHYLDQKH